MHEVPIRFSLLSSAGFLHRVTPREDGRIVTMGGMRFQDVLDRAQLLLVACHDCGARTPLDPAPIALRLGVQAEIATVAGDMTCPMCGSADVTLGVHSPVAARQGAPQLAK